VSRLEHFLGTEWLANLTSTGADVFCPSQPFAAVAHHAWHQPRARAHGAEPLIRRQAGHEPVARRTAAAGPQGARRRRPGTGMSTRTEITPSSTGSVKIAVVMLLLLVVESSDGITSPSRFQHWTDDSWSEVGAILGNLHRLSTRDRTRRAIHLQDELHALISGDGKDSREVDRLMRAYPRDFSETSGLAALQLRAEAVRFVEKRHAMLRSGDVPLGRRAAADAAADAGAGAGVGVGSHVDEAQLRAILERAVDDLGDWSISADKELHEY
jgi:hypothetical protein